MILDNELRCSLTLLLIELYLRVHQPDKALSVITYVENLMNVYSLEKNTPDLNKQDDKILNGESTDKEVSS